MLVLGFTYYFFNEKVKMMQKLMIVISLVAIFVMNALVESALAEKPIVIKFSHVAAEDTPKGQMAIKFRELVAERLAGKVVVEVFPDSQLYGDNNVLEAMLLGDVQMAAPSVSKIGAYSKGMQVFDLPFLFDSRMAVERFQTSPEGRQLLNSLNEKGLVGLGYLNDDLKILSATKPLRVPADAAGLRFRIQPSQVLAAQFNVLHATSLKKPFSQITTLLQDNAIDGQENTWTNIFSKKIFVEQPYITVSNHGVVSFLVVTSATFLEKLKEPVRQEIQQALNEAIAFGNNLAEQYSSYARQKITASHHTEIITLSDTERLQWKNTMRSVWQEFEGDIGKKLIEAACQSNQPNNFAQNSGTNGI
jgi:C4-dicarboxylate-binding protein DctP